jgi:hypothetical protein
MQTDFDTGQDVRQKAEETASTLVDQAQQVVEKRASTQKERAAETLGSVAQSIREAGSSMREQQPQIASLADQAASRVEGVSTYIRDHEVRDLISETERLARREPLLFLGGAFAVGFIAARFLKASSPERGMSGNRQSQYDRQYPRLTAGHGSAYGPGNGGSAFADTGYGAGAQGGGSNDGGGQSASGWHESSATADYSDPAVRDLEQPDVTEAAQMAGLDTNEHAYDSDGDGEGRR